MPSVLIVIGAANGLVAPIHDGIANILAPDHYAI
jgi:hypothetical protein